MTRQRLDVDTVLRLLRHGPGQGEEMPLVIACNRASFAELVDRLKGGGWSSTVNRVRLTPGTIPVMADDTLPDGQYRAVFPSEVQA